jgi:H+/Cl- antiporter ClcA
MKEQTASTSISLYTIVFIIFLILKLTGNIDWSWWWVTSPIWIPILLFVGVLVIVFLFGLLYVATTGKNIEELIEKIQKKD